MSILYLGGYLSYVILDQYVNNILIEGYVEGTSLGLKGNILVFIFVLVRASLPRIRFDQLMTVCWTIFLPLLFGLIFIYLLLAISFDSLPLSVMSLFIPGLICFQDRTKFFWAGK